MKARTITLSPVWLVKLGLKIDATILVTDVTVFDNRYTIKIARREKTKIIFTRPALEIVSRWNAFNISFRKCKPILRSVLSSVPFWFSVF